MPGLFQSGWRLLGLRTASLLQNCSYGLGLLGLWDVNRSTCLYTSSFNNKLVDLRYLSPFLTHRFARLHPIGSSLTIMALSTKQLPSL